MRSTSFNLMLDWAQLGTHICSSESPINLTALRSATSASFYLTERKNIAQSEGDVRAGSVCSRARQGKEGRKGSRKEECHIFTNSRKVTQTLSAKHLNQNACGGGSNGAPPLITATTPIASGASHITTLVVVYLLLPKHVFVLHFLTLKGKGGELYLV